MAAPDRNPEPHSFTSADNKPVFVPEEIDSTKWQMPPWTPIGIALLVILIAMGIIAYVTRPTPKIAGTIDDVYAAAMSDNSVLVTIKLNIQNVGGKSLWIHHISTKLVTDKGEFTDDAANASDFPRYISGYPDLRSHTITPIKAEDKIDPGMQERGSIIVAFPVSLQDFNARKSISVIVKPYDQNSVTITK